MNSEPLDIDKELSIQMMRVNNKQRAFDYLLGLDLDRRQIEIAWSEYEKRCAAGKKLNRFKGIITGLGGLFITIGVGIVAMWTGRLFWYIGIIGIGMVLYGLSQVIFGHDDFENA